MSPDFRKKSQLLNFGLVSARALSANEVDFDFFCLLPKVEIFNTFMFKADNDYCNLYIIIKNIL